MTLADALTQAWVLSALPDLAAVQVICILVCADRTI